MARRTTDERLQAYHDGELSRLSRFRVRASLMSSAADREELERIGLLGELVREGEGAVPEPDLWSGIRGRLAAIDADVETRHPPGRELWGRSYWRARPLRLGLAVAALGAVLLVFGPQLGGPPGSTRVVRSLVTEGKPAMVLPTVGDTTIIWVIEPAVPDEVSQRRNRVVT